MKGRKAEERGTRAGFFVTREKGTMRLMDGGNIPLFLTFNKEKRGLRGSKDSLRLDFRDQRGSGTASTGTVIKLPEKKRKHGKKGTMQ